MPKKDARPGWRGLYLELPDELDNQLRDHCRRADSRVADEVRLAIRRHLAYPPPPQTPPLPPILPDSPVAAKKSGRGKKKGLTNA
jgi:hypothetical protein